MKQEHWIVVEDWPARPAPHRSSGNTLQDILHAWLLAAGIVAICGTVLFGTAAIVTMVLAVAAAVSSDLVFSLVTRRPVIGGLSHAALTGLLLGLTLPATVYWYVPIIGSAVAIVFGKGLFGGLGHYIWQPALVGRVLVQFLFPQQLSLFIALTQSPILAPGHLLVGDIRQARAIDMGTYQGWSGSRTPPLSEAWLMERPVQTLRRFAEGEIKADGDLVYEPLLRDSLPPWRDTVFGLVPGGIGETCTLAVIVAGLYLIYRGYLRWQVPVAMLGSAALAAAILPVEMARGAGGYDWLPVLTVEQGRALGLAYVLYHLTAGQLMLGAFLLAGDMIASPMRVRGQAIFAAAVGVLTIFMRLYGILEGECYWAILIMNSFVAMIDRRTKRAVLGMAM
ncbi:MAG TPA: RnfABCDGE type electron transport complex subunit D [Phycisphaerae bacterium]|nr:RnfABCDGE type electron transport complex subunit D [Phycisphaerae bacterium]